MTERQWQTVLAVGAAVVVFLLAQPLVQQSPVAMLILGVVNVAIGALSPTRLALPADDGPDEGTGA